MRTCARFGAFCVVLMAQPAGAVSMLTDRKLHAIVCGSGSPLRDPERAGVRAAVIAGQQVILIDACPGSWRKATIAKVPGDAVKDKLLVAHDGLRFDLDPKSE